MGHPPQLQFVSGPFFIAADKDRRKLKIFGGPWWAQLHSRQWSAKLESSGGQTGNRWGPVVLWGLDRFIRIYRKTAEALRHNVSVVFYSSSQIVVCKVLLQQSCRLFRCIYSCASVSQASRRTAHSHTNPPRFSLRCYFPHCSNACSTFPISPSMQIACFWISLGQYASAKLIQA